MKNLLIDKVLNVDKILSLQEDQRSLIMDMFYRLLDSLNGEYGQAALPGGIKIDIISYQLIYDTLVEYEYLVTKREKRLNEILK